MKVVFLTQLSINLSLGDEEQLQVILKEVWMNVVEPDTCQELLRKTKLGRFFQLDRESFMCAGGEVDVDMCTVFYHYYYYYYYHYYITTAG